MHEKIVLPNGVRILTEALPYVRSVSVGIWTKSGSRYETPRQNGVSHFIEHMAFKGTARRSALQLAEEMDGIGGQVNAFTSKEVTCFHARVLDTHLPIALDLLCDMFFESSIAPPEVETERSVILEEIGMYEDTPEDKVSEMLLSSVFRSSPLGMPVLGSASNIRRFSASFIRKYWEENYRPQDTVIALSGSFTRQDVELLRQRFGEMQPKPDREFAPAAYSPAFRVRHKPIEQNHLCLAYPAVSMLSEERHAFTLLSSILGGGMSSRLFQSVREARGLCYTIYSFGAQHEDAGLLGIYAALGRQTQWQALRLIRQELDRFLQSGVTQEELDRAREQVKAGILMGLESTNARMNRLARGELFFGRVADTDELTRRYDAITKEELLALSRRILRQDLLSFSAVGQVDPAPKYRDVLQK